MCIMYIKRKRSYFKIIGIFILKECHVEINTFVFQIRTHFILYYIIYKILFFKKI